MLWGIRVPVRGKQMKAGREKKSHTAVRKKECCILCGKLTEIMKDCPVSERAYYLEGAGQLCRKCYQELYMQHHHNENVVQLIGRNTSENWFL